MRKLFIVCLALMTALSVFAEYQFQVPENRCVVTVNKDASVTVAYTVSFANEGQPIDIIDVGLPDSNYEAVLADLDGAPMVDIRPSTAVASGVEVHLGERAIPAGHRGTLHLSARLRGRVYEDDKDNQYASLVFSPTWYGSEFTNGTTLLACEFVLPEGINSDEPRYHDRAFTSSRLENGRVHYIWEIPDASPSSQYTFGASFPKRVMDNLVEKPKGPGFFAVLLGLVLRFVGASFQCACPLLFVGAFVWGIIQSRKRKMQYLPPSVGMEGSEVRRGLTVPEVAILMQSPLDRVMALLLFGMLRKGLVRVVSRQPLKLEAVAGTEPAFSYEKEFATAIQDDGKVDPKEAARIVTDLIKRVQEKMKGFSRAKSLAYYKEIMTKAWDQVGSEDYSQAFEWLLLDGDFSRTATARYGTRSMPLPIWWGGVRGSSSTQSPVSSVPLGGAGVPGPVGAANTIVSGFESFGHDLVNSVPGLATAVTQTTNPVPISSSGGHSGGGCACACACAGCACACAGGGR